MIDFKDKSNCCGCYSCYNICPKKAIEMVEDEKGFKYPKIDKEKCINCGLCEKVCPIIANLRVENKPEAYACMNKDEDIRIQSSSGGIFTVLASYIIDKGGIVFGASWNEDFTKVEHTYTDKKEELYKFRGAKYLQSDINKSYEKAKEFLDEGKYVLFSGTPCQIEALKLFLRKDYEKLYLQDIICHGVPSPKSWSKYKDYIESKYEDKMQSMYFRDKTAEGWNKYHVKIQFENEHYYDVEHGKDVYMKAFLSNISLRDSCTSCKFKKENRVSDITLADFWGINDIKPEMNDEKGTSLVIVNSEKGKDLFNKISDNVKSEKVDFYRAIKPNPSMNNISPKNSKNEEFFEDINKKSFDEVVKKYVPEPSIAKKVLRKVKRIVKKIIKK